MAFPDPQDETTYTLGTKTWEWDGQKWVLMSIDIGLPQFDAELPIVVEETPGTSTTPSVVEYGHNTDSMSELVLP